MTTTIEYEPGLLAPGVPGLERVLPGGFPGASLNLVVGPPGSGKTLFTQQLGYSNATPERRVLFVTTLSEPSDRILRHMRRFDFFDAEKVGSRVVYSDLGELFRRKRVEEVMEALAARIEENKPAMVVVDSFKAIHEMAKDSLEERQLLYDLSSILVDRGITAFLVGEYSWREISKRSIFSFADGILCLHYEHRGDGYRRYMDLYKMRGRSHVPGRHPLSIGHKGIGIYPRFVAEGVHSGIASASGRISAGLAELDLMLSGGVPRGSVCVALGNAGTGKTLLGLHFLMAGVEQGEPGLLVGFRESPVQLADIGRSFGWDLKSLEEDGMLAWRHLPSFPDPDIQAARLAELADQMGARRIFIDSVHDMGGEAGFRDNGCRARMSSLIHDFRLQEITTFLAEQIPGLSGSLEMEADGIASMADVVLVLRYVELSGRLKRAVHVLKARGCSHSKEIREYEIADRGIRIGNCLHAVTGLLNGNPVFAAHSNLLYLPLRARYVVESLRQTGVATVADLMRLTGLSRKDVLRQMEKLHQRKMVIAIERGDETLYKATI